MKKINQSLLALLCSFILMIPFFTVNVHAQNIDEMLIVSPAADIIEWRFQYINGVLHKRQFNFSTQTWIGKWVPVRTL